MPNKNINSKSHFLFEKLSCHSKKKRKQKKEQVAFQKNHPLVKVAHYIPEIKLLVKVANHVPKIKVLVKRHF